MNIQVRQARLSDAAVIADYNVRLAFETENLRLDSETVHAGVCALLEAPLKGLYFVAEVEGAVVGQVMITYEWSDWRNGNIWWLQSVYVKEELRRAGIFRTLFHHVEEMARANADACGLRLYMHTDNSTARHSYEKLGMKQTHYEVFELAL